VSKPKGHHFYPRLCLQHFAGTEPGGQVWTYDAISGKVWSAIPEETAVETHFYSAEQPDGTMDTRVEDFLSDVESRAAPVYEGLLSGIVPGAAQARTDFAQFLAVMYARTPTMRRMSAEIHGRGLQIHSYAYASDDEAFERLTRQVENEKGEPMDPQIKEEIRKRLLDPSGFELVVPKELTLSALTISDRLVPLFYKMKWSLLSAGHGFFITSDNPVVREVDPRSRHPIYGDHGFLNRSAEVTFPLSPKLILLLSWDQDAPDQAELKRQHVELMNNARAACSERYLYAHLRHSSLEKLAAKFKHSRPMMTTEGFGPKRFAPIKVSRRSKKE
jgi:hypothetical protein